MEELVQDFSIDAYSGSDSLFDPDKLLWLNGAHLRALPLDRLLSELGLNNAWADRVALLRENGKTLIEIREFLDIFESSGIHAGAFDYLSRIKGLEGSLALLGETLAGNAKKSFEEIYEAMEKSTGLARRDLMMLLRIAITGRKSGPPLKEVFRLTPEQIILERVSCLQKKFEVSVSA
jgi:glutamyl/glutaminyl-tRNA synthetase